MKKRVSRMRLQKETLQRLDGVVAAGVTGLQSCAVTCSCNTQCGTCFATCHLGPCNP
jgi:hypothetical protein